MKHLSSFWLLVSAALLFSSLSCTGPDTGPTAPQAIWGAGNNVFTCKVNGELFIARAFSFDAIPSVRASYGSIYTPDSSAQSFSVRGVRSGQTDNMPQGTISMDIYDCSGVGTYALDRRVIWSNQLGDFLNSGFVGLRPTGSQPPYNQSVPNPNSYTTSRQDTGYLKIEREERLVDANGVFKRYRVIGSFAFKAHNILGQAVEITEGRFYRDSDNQSR